MLPSVLNLFSKVRRLWHTKCVCMCVSKSLAYKSLAYKSLAYKMCLYMRFFCWVGHLECSYCELNVILLIQFVAINIDNVLRTANK